MKKTNLKVGSRHSATDQGHLDSALSHLIDAGAQQPQPPASAHEQRVVESVTEAQQVARGKAIYTGKAVNYTQIIAVVSDAWEDAHEPPEGMVAIGMEPAPCVVEVSDDSIVVCDAEGEYYRVPYTFASGEYTFAPEDQWIECNIAYVPSPVQDEAKTIVSNGASIKALGDGKVGGYLVVFGDENTTDLEGDFFTKSTSFGSHTTSLVYYHHGLDGTMKRAVLDDAAMLKADDYGVWCEAQLKMRDDYERFIYRQVEAGKAGWSSGTASHLVEREPRGKAMWIKAWPLGLDASITLTPAEPRARALPIKSSTKATDLKALLEAEQSATQGNGAGAEAVSTNSDSGVEMQDQNAATAIADLVAEVKSLREEVKARGSSVQIESRAGFAGVQAVDVPDTRPFKSFGEQLKAIVKAYDKQEPETDKRLYSVKAPTGLNEQITSEGGFLVQTDFAQTLLERMYDTGQIVNRCSPIAISDNANGTRINAFDETSRADGSRWGGVQAFWQAEANQFTGKKPGFRQIELKLGKLTGLCYATDETLQDASQLESIIMRVFPLEFAFKVEDAIINGNGAGIPLGILNAPSLVTVSKEAGQAAKTIVSQNIINMWSRLWGRSMQNAVWLVNQDTLPQLYTMSVSVGVGGVPVFLPPNGLSSAPYATLFNRPVVPVEYCQTLGTVGDIILADFGEYLVARKGTVQTASSIHLRFDYDETVFRFTMRMDGRPAWNAALTPKNGTNTLSPFVTLAAR